MSGPLQVLVAVAGRSAVVSLRGELDLSTAPGLERELHGLPGDLESVVVLARDLEFLDTAGLDALVALRDRLQAAGTSFLLRDPSAPVRRLLQLLDGPLSHG